MTDEEFAREVDEILATARPRTHAAHRALDMLWTRYAREKGGPLAAATEKWMRHIEGDHADNQPYPIPAAPSGSDLGEGVVERVRRAILGRLRGIDDEYNRAFDNGIRAAEVVAVQALSTPSSTLTPDADVDGLVTRLECLAHNVLSGAAAEDVLLATRRLASRDRLVLRLIADANEEKARADEALSATPVIREQAFEEAARAVREEIYPKEQRKDWIEWSRQRAHLCELAETAIRALKGTPPTGEGR